MNNYMLSSVEKLEKGPSMHAWRRRETNNDPFRRFKRVLLAVLKLFEDFNTDDCYRK